MKTPRERYLTDPFFRKLVDMLYHAIEHAELTPTEIREAAMLANIKWEETKPWPSPLFNPCGNPPPPEEATLKESKQKPLSEPLK